MAEPDVPPLDVAEPEPGLRRDRLLLILLVVVTTLALGGGWLGQQALVRDMTEAFAEQRALDFTEATADALNLIDAQGRLADLDEPERAAVFAYAQKAAHILRLLVLDQQGKVLLDTDGESLGQTVDQMVVVGTARSGTPHARLLSPKQTAAAFGAYGAIEVAEIHMPLVVGGGRTSVAELYLDVTDDIRPIRAGVQQAFAAAAAVVLAGFALNFAILLRSLRVRRQRYAQLADLHRQAEEARAAVAAMLAQQRRFTANAAHELRTPLAVLRARVAEMAAGQARAILDGDVVRLARVVDQLLAIARLEAGQGMAPEAVDLCAVARDTVAGLFPLALKAGRSIELTAPAGAVMVQAQPHALGDALRNLVENALRFTPPGSTVAVTVEEGTAIAGPALVVRDHGPGIPEGQRSQVFEPFWRGAGQGEGEGGAGLGLAIVREIAARNGASVSVGDCPDGPGAAFRIAF
ncbi:sensor histidine kinase [Zavarzinia sp. CC-PAN008]|uniref:sensor histidine kinase n=1 Tax=Zavarzinia sp. CC-PAN008 TaxID=3243332 RepID=UPI003F74AC9D